MNSLDGFDQPDIRGLLNEIYDSMASGSRRLALMGCRTVIERIMTYRVGDKGKFKAQLDAMLSEGHLSASDHDALAAAVDAGSAAAHRGYLPTQQVLEQVLSITERLAQSVAVEEAGEAIRNSTPPRPPRGA